jgi:CRISPR-associated protein Csd1
MNNTFGSLSSMLDKQQTDPAYLCGRLLAVLARAQAQTTKPGAGVVDRFYGAASSTPAAVFGALLRSAQHHLAKREASYLSRDIEEICAKLGTFPRTLSLQEQGLFALGFYHQRQAFFSPRTTPPAEEQLDAEEPSHTEVEA